MASEVKEANISTGLVNLLNHFIFESLVNLRITAIWYNIKKFIQELTLKCLSDGGYST